MHRVQLSKHASKALEKAMPALEQRLSQVLTDISGNVFLGKGLHGKLEGMRSVRVGDWRIVYEIDDKNSVVVVHGIGPRGQIYKD
ncbi:MAG: Type II toxin-antitoxin system RelE/ParE family toxin [Dehalococcoidia bacterium]|nr:Type II toxin-antitoxin system RelE/ParE family toxin [Dehalococcoidia bacterium]